ncbi:MAG: NAD(P)H-dependent oxidoreductase subunit E [Pseudomonadota bacterium]
MGADRPELEASLAEWAEADGALLPILRAVQAAYGCIDEPAVRQIADRLNLTRAEVHGVVSFYDDFTTTPAERPVIRICRAEACQARGVEAMMPDFARAADGLVDLGTVYCLGVCGVGPAAIIGETVIAKLDPARLRAAALAAQ